MTPAEFLRSLLVAAPSVTALVQQRVYPLRIAQGVALPAVAYQQISLVPGRCDGYDRLRYQVSLFASSYAQLSALAAATRAALHGYEIGEIYCELDQEIDQFDEAGSTYFRTQDFFLEYPNPQFSNHG